MKRSRGTIGGAPLALAAALVATLACSAPVVPGAATLPPGPFETALAATVGAAASQTAAVLPTATTSLTPEPSATPTITLTPTPEEAFALLSENTHCRKGPLLIYDLVATVLEGEQVKILGANSAGDYWYITASNGKDCWMWGRYAQVSGNTGQVPVFTPPPTPMPDWTGTWEVMVDALAGTMKLTQTGSNFTGTLTSGPQVYDLTGHVTDGGQKASGDVFNAGIDVADFSWLMLDDRDQFRGSFVDPDPGVWCGGRDGASAPSPCGWP